MFKVVKISQQWQGRDNVAPSHETLIVDGIDTKESALVLAEVAASEHADGIGVQYEHMGSARTKGTGFKFRTSNGTDVWYVVTES